MWDPDDASPPARGAAGRLVPSASPGIPTYYPDGGLPGEVMPDSEFTRLLPRFGVLLMLRHDAPTGDTASFYLLASRDSTRSLRELGFVQAASLLDSTAGFETLGDSLPPSLVRSRAVAGNDSVLRRRDSECVLESPIPLVGAGAATSAWLMALMPGSAEALSPAAWRAPVTGDDRRLAFSLARTLRPDSGTSRLAGPAAFAAIPFTIKSLHRFSLDGTEYLVADVRRECSSAECFARQGEDDQEQRVFVAERDAGDPGAAFRVAWKHYVAGSSDNQATYEPVLMLRMGQERLLTLYLTADTGGLFIARVSPGTWSPLAEWYGGC